jgi:hypothetical protein
MPPSSPSCGSRALEVRGRYRGRCRGVPHVGEAAPLVTPPSRVRRGCHSVWGCTAICNAGPAGQSRAAECDMTTIETERLVTRPWRDADARQTRWRFTETKSDPPAQPGHGSSAECGGNARVVASMADSGCGASRRPLGCRTPRRSTARRRTGSSPPAPLGIWRRTSSHSDENTGESFRPGRPGRPGRRPDPRSGLV